MSENNGVTGERQVVVFDLNEEAHGVDISQVREIIRMEEITRVPRAPEFTIQPGSSSDSQIWRTPTK